MCANGKGYDTYVSYAIPVPTPTPDGVSIRVTKGMGSKGYDAMRLSLIRYSGSAPSASSADLEWTYKEPFKYRWTGNNISTALVNVTPGAAQDFILDGNKINVKIPKRTDGSIGILIGDPCIQSPWNNACSNGENYRNKQVLNSVLNGMAIHDELDYWVLMGDLFYDNIGDKTHDFFKGLSLEASSKPAGAVMGNHDFWICGSPDCAAKGDSFANGHMQWYAQDTYASLKNDSEPFDFSVNPDSQKKTAIENTIWYNMVGNVATLGFSNAFSWDESKSYFEAACQWVEAEQPALVIMIGHWHGSGMGCPTGMDTDHVYDSIQTLPGCDKLGGKLKYFEGHTHTNQILKKDTGFLLGSFGFDGGGNQLGLPILDTRNGMVKLNYFELGNNGQKSENFDEILGCISAKGYSACEHYATSWMNQSLAELTAA
jgi:hypothetical protein